ncbi:hypothetical protein QS413_12730 [Staphylococcus pseudintermedius]|uniref:hypothetical protein n=1 Tax=Staphylococcus pseudintermedius TaxID=283734 RepID=UPI00286EA775|nr:hypothetical protein [Staphylococcus pseudintermedius]WMZ50334.1 hypothetical protein QS413_12730 [Staphylococcus pseudintermedius]
MHRESLSDTDVDFDALSESLVDVLVDLLNDAESLSDTDVDVDALSESLVDVLVDLLNDADVLSESLVDVLVDLLNDAESLSDTPFCTLNNFFISCFTFSKFKLITFFV